MARDSADAGLCDPVELRIAIRLRLLPGAFDEPALLQPNECRIQGALVEDEWMVGDLLETCRQPVRVQRAHRVERAQDNQIESPLQQLDGFGVSTSHSSDLPGP